ncbi:MAG: hypothetical protein JWM41_4314 [Gemmatimonadetes bacterium]|nr:hypothetical protein [Gemmatimonadota bacterium]
MWPSRPPRTRHSFGGLSLPKKPNYDFEKRKKEQDRKKKKDAKREERLQRKRDGLPEIGDELDAPVAEPE